MHKFTITVVNSYQGSITGSSIWKEIYGTNKFVVPVIIEDSMNIISSISSASVYLNPMDALVFEYYTGTGTQTEDISSSTTWEDHIISF